VSYAACFFAGVPHAGSEGFGGCACGRDDFAGGAGWAGLFSGAGIFVLHLKGEGHIAVSSFGAIMEVPIPAGEQYVVDNGHLVAWSGDTEYKIVKAATGWVSSFTTGGMLACQFTGPGKVWLQTRNPNQFGNWVRRFVPRGVSLIG